MAIILLIRHGETDDVENTLAGQINTHLNRSGLKQSKILAQHLSKLPIEAIFSSPLMRPQETAAPLAEILNKPVKILNCIDQVDFGEWQGVSFDNLAKDERWQIFQKDPGSVGIPGGENTFAIKARVTKCYNTLSEAFSENSIIATFTHGSIIRHCVSSIIGIPIQNLNRMRIAPASITTIKITPEESKLLHLNQELPANYI